MLVCSHNNPLLGFAFQSQTPPPHTHTQTHTNEKTYFFNFKFDSHQMLITYAETHEYYKSQRYALFMERTEGRTRIKNSRISPHCVSITVSLCFHASRKAQLIKKNMTKQKEQEMLLIGSEHRELRTLSWAQAGVRWWWLLFTFFSKLSILLSDSKGEKKKNNRRLDGVYKLESAPFS